MLWNKQKDIQFARWQKGMTDGKIKTEEGQEMLLGGNDTCSKPEKVRKDIQAVRTWTKIQMCQKKKRNTVVQRVPLGVKLSPTKFSDDFIRKKKNPQSRTSGFESCLHQLTTYLCDFEQVTFSLPQFLIFQTRIIKISSL